MLQKRLKRKPDLETPDDSLPPSLKRRTRARSYANSDLAVSLPFISPPTAFYFCHQAQPISAVYYHSTDRAFQVSQPHHY
jgi:hypothetical protein